MMKIKALSHMLKKTAKAKMGHTLTTTDPVFEELNAQFLSFCHNVESIRMRVRQNMEAMRSLAEANTGVTEEVASVYQHQPDHTTALFLSGMLASSDVLLTEETEAALSYMEQEVLLRIHRLEQLLASLHQRIKERNDLRDEMDYYSGKVNKLREMAAQGREQKQADKDRRTRNEATLGSLQAQFGSCNNDIIRDLREVVASRLNILAPTAFFLHQGQLMFALSCAKCYAGHTQPQPADFQTSFGIGDGKRVFDLRPYSRDDDESDPNGPAPEDDNRDTNKFNRRDSDYDYFRNRRDSQPMPSFDPIGIDEGEDDGDMKSSAGFVNDDYANRDVSDVKKIRKASTNSTASTASLNNGPKHDAIELEAADSQEEEDIVREDQAAAFVEIIPAKPEELEEEELEEEELEEEELEEEGEEELIDELDEEEIDC